MQGIGKQTVNITKFILGKLFNCPITNPAFIAIKKVKETGDLRTNKKIAFTKL